MNSPLMSVFAVPGTPGTVITASGTGLPIRMHHASREAPGLRGDGWRHHRVASR